MTTYNSDQMANIKAVPSVKNAVCDFAGKLRIARFSYAQGAASTGGEYVRLVQLPAGRVRLIGQLSYLLHNLTTGGMTIDLGWEAYTDLDGDTVVADPNGLDNDISVETTGTLSPLATVLDTTGYTKVFESQTGVVITMTGDGVIAEDDYVYGDIVYATD